MLNDIAKLGDPHLGRRFTKGIPIEMRGQRERLVREDFVRQLDPKGAEIHVCMGDLFDKPQVAYADTLFAIQAYRTAAEAHPNTRFYIIQGNHDASRDLTEVAAWDVFCDAMRSVPNVHPVTGAVVNRDYMLLAWHPTRSAVEQLAEAKVLMGMSGHRPKLAFGHWDIDPRSAHHNLIPTKELAELGITHAYTGHVHLPSTFKRDGVHVEVVGSMQPYAQGEDGGQSDHIRYETVTLERLQEILEVAPQALSNACVRLQLAPGEQFDGDVPLCRSWDVQRLRLVDEETPADISMEGFDTTAVAREALDAHEIIPAVRQKIDARWSEAFGNGQS
ncbi:metallophosphoesterase [Methylorubrum populi]|uniref:metallophosphoesterase n=1 Tax=Methylorubrum populi TaxID=223967 RepID=UPI00235597BD|nr:metallophosphoesterase [Methylorubrum populi]